MKHLLKKYEKFLSIHHYITFLRRQPEHMQHVYAAIFAGSITMIIAAFILYVDYGFWHETYSRQEVIEVKDTTEPMVTVQSPGDMMGGFFKEARDRVQTINISSPSNVLKGTDSYTREDN